MNLPEFSKLWIALLALALLSSGCGPVKTPEVTQIPTQTVEPLQPAQQVTDTVQPTPKPLEMPTGPGAVWDLVVIGDSSMWEHGQAIANQIGKDLGVKVELSDYAMPVLKASTVLEALQTGKSPNARLESLPDKVREAEMVVLFVNPLGSIGQENPLDLDGCFNVSPPKACEMETFTQYTADLKAIWEKIIELRAGQPTVLRATDIYNPLVDSWDRNSIFDACNLCWKNMSAAARQGAEAYNIPFLSRYDTFNGPDHREDPKVKGYIQEDGEHPSPQGADFTAQLLSEMGYEPTIP